MLHILLPVHQRRAITERFMGCLLAQRGTPYRLILLDDGSTDGTSERVKELLPEVTVIRGDGSWWWAGALQAGFKWLEHEKISDTDSILLINDDTEFESNFLKAGVEALQRNNRSLVVAQCVDRDTGSMIDRGVKVDWSRMTFHQAKPGESIDCVSTRGLFLMWGVFREIGGFYPQLLPHYASDYEFTMRAKRKGFTLQNDPAVILRGDPSQTGIKTLKPGALKPVLEQLFSKRSVHNPIYWSTFIALACPWPWKLLNWARVWRGAWKLTLTCVLNSRNRAT